LTIHIKSQILFSMNVNSFTEKISALPMEYQQVLIEHPALYELIEELVETIEKQRPEIAELRLEAKHFHGQSQLDNYDSSKPTFADQNRTRSRGKIVSLRKSTSKKPKGQESHPESTLQIVTHPDNTISHKFKIYSRCHNVSRGNLPEGVTRVVQYGEKLKSFAAYLNQYQLISCRRVSRIFQDLFRSSISQGTLLNAIPTSYDSLKPVESWIKKRILHLPIVHFGETGIYLNGKRSRLHSPSAEEFTCYFPHSSRSKKKQGKGKNILKHAGVFMPNFSKHPKEKPFCCLKDRLCSHKNFYKEDIYA